MDLPAYLGIDLPTYLFAQTGALTLWFLIIGLPLSWLLARFFFKRKEPDTRASYSVAITFFVFAVLFGLGGDPDWWFSKWEGVFYVPGALLSWLFLRWRFRKKTSSNTD